MDITMEFDYNKANDLKRILGQEFNRINSRLNDTEKEIKKVKDWWYGDSAQAFIEEFGKTKNRVSEMLEEWLDEYKDLIEKVKLQKEASEQAMAQALNG